MTNFEKIIQQITPKDLATHIVLNNVCCACPANGVTCDGETRDCVATVTKWLQMEADKEEKYENSI